MKTKNDFLFMKQNRPTTKTIATFKRYLSQEVLDKIKQEVIAEFGDVEHEIKDYTTIDIFFNEGEFSYKNHM